MITPAHPKAIGMHQYREHWSTLVPHALCLPLQVMVEAYRRDASSKEQLISELKTSKKRLAAEVKELKEEVLKLQGEKASGEQEQQRLLQEVQRVQQQMTSLEQHLQTVQTERDQLDTQLQVQTPAQICRLPILGPALVVIHVVPLGMMLSKIPAVPYLVSKFLCWQERVNNDHSLVKMSERCTQLTS